MGARDERTPFMRLGVKPTPFSIGEAGRTIFRSVSAISRPRAF